MLSVIWYAMYVPLVMVEMGNRRGKTAAQSANVRRRTSGGASLIPGSKHNRAGHSGEKLVGGRIEAGLAKAGL